MKVFLFGGGGLILIGLLFLAITSGSVAIRFAAKMLGFNKKEK